MWKDMLYVGLGGGIGSIMRFLTSRFASRFFQAEWLWMGTFITNLIGCFLIGWLSGWIVAHSGSHPALRLLFVVGFCGGYTTFSTFAFENLRLLQSGQYVLLFFYLIMSVLLGIAAVWLGMRLGK